MGSDPLLDSALAEAGWLRQLARSLVRDSQRAEDAVQDTLAKALERRPERASLRAWLATVLRNGLRQEARSRARREFHERRTLRQGSTPSAQDVNARLELQRLLLDAVRTLEEPYRSAIVARFFDGLAPRAIARREGVPVRTVNTRLERGLAKLRGRLDGKFGGERGTWLQALAPFAVAPGWSWTSLGEGLSMGAKAKLAGALAAAGIGLLWVARVAHEPDARERPETTPPIRESTSETSGAPLTLLEPARAELASERPAREAQAAEGRGAAAPERAPPTTAAATGNAHLDVLVVKRHTGVQLPTALVVVTVDSSSGAMTSRLIAERDEPLASATTDALGKARLDVPHGRALWLSIDPGGWHGRPDEPPERLQRTAVPIEPLEPGEARALVVEIEHGSDRALEGRVVAAEDGRPLAGASIAPERSYGPPLTSDEHGNFAVPYSSWEPPERVEIALQGFTPVILEPRWVDQVPGVPIEVALERDALVVARVAGARSGELDLRARAERGRHDALVPRIRLDARGLGELSVPARLPFTLEIVTREGELAWRDAETWTLEPGERRELVLALDGGALVWGFLLDDAGQPIAGDELWAVPADDDEDEVAGEQRYLEGERGDALVAQTRRDGRFEFPALAFGAWWIGPAPRDADERAYDEAIAPGAELVELPVGTTSRRLDLIGHRGLWITGRVQGQDGRALGQIMVGCGRGRNATERQAYTDDQGRFRIGPLFPATYLLRVFGGDGTFGWAREALHAEAGASDVVLVLPSRHSIGGRVVDRDGHAVDAHVHLLQRNSSLGQGTSQREQGAFLFFELDPGVYSVQAEAPDGSVAVQRVVLAEGGRIEGVVLTLKPGTRIGVKHDLAHGVRCAIWAGDALAADSTVGPDGLSLETVPAGPLRVELYSGDRIVAVKELVGRAGRVESAEFDLEPGR